MEANCYDRFPSLLQDDRILKSEEFSDEWDDFDSDLEELLGGICRRH